MDFILPILNSLPGAAAQGLIWGIVAIGVHMTYRVLDIADLSIDGSIATGGAVCVMLIRAGANPWVAMLCAFLAGAAAGLITGLLHTKCGIPAILAGILTQLALYSVNLRILAAKSNQAISVDRYGLVVSQRYVHNVDLSNPLPLLVIIVAILIAVLYWFLGTERGCSLRATGANRNMAKAQGINTNSNIVLGLVISNGMVAFAGALLSQYQGSADVNMGRGAIVIGLAALTIGEVFFNKIFRNYALRLMGIVFGAVIYYIVLQIVLQFGLNTNDLKLFTAVVVAIFLMIPYLKGKWPKRAGKEARSA
ncbi:MAG: ABC transporter permease [Eubacteriales bacterium]|nr:ABC transporter permease [Eubacteriales bacterium]